MNLTPIDVEQKAFTQALRGYQMDEVDDFLDEVVGTLRTYEQRLRDAHDKIRVLESESPPSRGTADESEISRAILTAQRSADRLLTEARAEADSIRANAVAETSQLQTQRDAERSRLQDEVAGMSNLVGSLRSKLVALTTAVTSQVDEMENEISTAHGELGDRAEPHLDTVSEEQLLDDFDEMDPVDDVDATGEVVVDDTDDAAKAKTRERPRSLTSSRNRTTTSPSLHG